MCTGQLKAWASAMVSREICCCYWWSFKDIKRCVCGWVWACGWLIELSRQCNNDSVKMVESYGCYCKPQLPQLEKEVFRPHKWLKCYIASVYVHLIAGMYVRRDEKEEDMNFKALWWSFHLIKQIKFQIKWQSRQETLWEFGDNI